VQHEHSNDKDRKAGSEKWDTIEQLKELCGCTKIEETIMITSNAIKHEATEVSSSELNTMLRESDTAILVYVWAPWCPPCKSMTPALDDVAAEIGPDIRVVKLNAVGESQTLTALGIASVPTLLLFSAEGRELARLLGALNSSAILDWLSKNNASSHND